MFAVSSAVTWTSPDLKSNLQNFDPFILTFFFYTRNLSDIYILSCPYLHLIFSAGWWRILLKRSAQTGDIFNRVKCQRHSIDPQIKTDTSKGKTRLLRRAQPRASGWKREQTDAFQNTPSSITTEVKLIWSDSPPFKQQSPSEKSQFCSGLSLTPSLSYTWTGGGGGGAGRGGVEKHHF